MASKGEDAAARARVAELLVDILDHCGIWSLGEGEEQTAWELLSISLDRLSIRLEYLEKAETQRDQLSFNEILMDLEGCAQDVRVKLQCLENQNQEISEALQLCQELEDISRSEEFHNILPLSISLKACIQRQREDISKILRDVVEYLSLLYEDMVPSHPKRRDLVRSLRAASSTLSLRCIKPYQAPWNDAKDLVKQLLSIENCADDDMSVERPQLCVIADKRATIEPQPFPLTAFGGSSCDDALFQQDCIVDAARVFANQETHIENNKCFLVVGPVGSGKTFCLDRIQEQTPAMVNVIRPSLPYDLMGRKVGSAEDLLISMVAFAMGTPGKTLLLLDDIESVCGNNYEEVATVASGGEMTGTKGHSSEPHIAARIRTLLLCLLEAVRRSPTGNLMLICTARKNWGNDIDRFDRIFILENPTGTERRELIGIYNSKCQQKEVESNVVDDAILSNLVESTHGLTYSELTFHCRGALLDCNMRKRDSLGFLNALKSRLQQAIPDSLKNGANFDFVDIKVFTIRDLCESVACPGALSLYGHSIEHAWDELQRIIVTPLCHSKALHELMFHGDRTGGKTFVGGVLLTGDPGSGKTSLAYHCAALAASLNPSVKLLDVSCTSLIHKEVGRSEQAIHRLFQTAKSAAPCILLMDGIENVAAVRGNDNTTEGTMDRVLSTLLTELDGVDSGKNFSPDNPAGLAIIGITHNPNWVDPALRRAGRLERVIELGLPELEAREKIVERELSGIPITGFGGLDDAAKTTSTFSVATFVAERTEGFSCAAVVGVCNEAKMLASKDLLTDNASDEYHYSVTITHIKEAIDSQRAGRATK